MAYYRPTLEECKKFK